MTCRFASVRFLAQGVVGLGLFLGASGCFKESLSTIATCDEVDVTPDSVMLMVGQSQQMTGTTKEVGKKSSPVIIEWETLTPAIVGISISGVAEGLAPGVGRIQGTGTCKEGSFSDQAVITVRAVVASVTLSPTSATLVTGGTQQLTATPKDASGNALSGRTATWTTSDSTKARVSSTGLVTAVATGSATITATVEGKSATANITVAAPAIWVADPTFDPGAGANINVQAITQQPDGKILIGGIFDSYAGVTRNKLARVTTTGSLDASLSIGTGFNFSVTAITLQGQSAGKMLVVGQFTSFNATTRNRIVRLNADGTYDATFDAGTGANGDVYAVAVQSDGKILLGGTFSSVNGTARSCVARLEANGAVDPSFNIGTMATGECVYAMALQSDGKVVIGGSFGSVNGTTRARIARVNADGSLDTSFDVGTGLDGAVRAMALQSDGKVLIGGGFNTVNGTARPKLARLNTNGSLDTGFGATVGGAGLVYAIALQSDGKVFIGGGFDTVNGVSRVRIARLTTDGAVDYAFDPGTGVSADIYALSPQSDGKILLGGAFTTVNGVSRSRFARMSPP